MKKQILIALAVLCLLVPQWLEAQNACTLSVAISASAGSTQTLIAAVPGQTFYVCGFVVTGDTAKTGVLFNTGSTAITGTFLLPQYTPLTYGGGAGTVFQSSPGATITMTATTGAVSGVLSYR